MNNNCFYHLYLDRPVKSTKFFTLFIVFCLFCINVFEVNAQKYTSSGNIVITGLVKDDSGFTLPGVSVLVKRQTRGTATDLDGKFSIGHLSNNDILVFSFLGMKNYEYHVVKSKAITIKMSPSAIAIQEVVAVGYASQKRATLVGAVASVDSKKLESVNGLSNLTAAISGQLEGVNVQQTSGQPGSEKTDIIIRSATTWNSTAPLILVDGVERPMSDVDVNEVASISVLKDASATAVYGVKGGNGVILITTKRGEEGKPKVSAQYLAGMKWKSKMYGTMNSYDYLSYKNDAIEYDLYNNSAVWSDYTPVAIKNRYKYRETDMDKYLFPDVDWGEAMTKNVAWNHKANVSVSGGTDRTKYFTSISYQHEGDLLKTKDLGYGYDPSFSYNRINIRSNFDIDLTKSTVFSVNLNSITGFQKTPNSSELGNVLRRIYNCSSYLYPLMYTNGNFGFNPTVGVNNPYRELNSTGVKRMNTYQINGDFKLNQKLDFITKGLELSGRFSLDTRIYSTGKSVKDSEKTSEYIYVDKYLEGNIDNAIIYSPVNGNSYYDYDGGPIVYNNEGASKEVKRNYDYQVALKYNRSFGKHKVNGLGVFRRTKKAYGDVLPTLQEDWVGRLGYNYNDLYLLEVNGAYNGTDKFGPGYKFGFFPSIAGGWVVSNADFFHLDWINYLKLRASVGQVGSDAGASRFAYMDIWSAVGNKLINGYTTTTSRNLYPTYNQTVIGNSDIKWEVSTKQNYGLDSKFLDNKFNLGVEYWRDHRTDIFMSGFSRSVPSYFGANPVSANIGETKASGIELSLKYSDKTSWGLNYYTKVSYTQSRNKVVYAEDPELYDDYKKKEGHKIGQIYSFLDNGYINNYDDMYASLTEDGKNMAIGNLNMIDFNCDGKVDSKDAVPYGYTGSPENTLSFTLGGSYKGFSAFVMFYGVSNISQKVNSFASFGGQNGDVVFDIVSDYWTPNNINAKYLIPTTGDQHSYGTKEIVDGSYLRLKSAQIAYTFKGKHIKSLGLSALKLYANGNNLFFWSDLPSDQEKGNISTVYPNSCVANFGFNLTF